MGDFGKVIVSQFQNPRGWLGSLAGKIMYRRQSNRKRNLWMVRLLKLEDGLRVLELGCGPGFAIQSMLERFPNLEIHGLDHSEVMVKMASERVDNNPLVKFHIGDVSTIERISGGFDRICCANVHQFWSDEDAIFQSCFGKLNSGGRLVVTYLPRCKNPSNKTAEKEAQRLSQLFYNLGFESVTIEELPLRPVKAISVIGLK